MSAHHAHGNFIRDETYFGIKDQPESYRLNTSADSGNFNGISMLNCFQCSLVSHNDAVLYIAITVEDWTTCDTTAKTGVRAIHECTKCRTGYAISKTIAPIVISAATGVLSVQNRINVIRPANMRVRQQVYR